MSIHQRYNSKAAALYRDKISALAEGREWNREEALKRVGKTSSHSSSSNHLSHSKSAGALSNSYQDGASYQDQSTYQSREFKDQRDNFFNNLQAANAQRPDGRDLNCGGVSQVSLCCHFRSPAIGRWEICRYILSKFIQIFTFLKFPNQHRLRQHGPAATEIPIRHGFRRNAVFSLHWMEFTVLWRQQS